MSDTAVSLLTAPGTGAIATVEVRGPRAWELAKQLFKPASKLLPESPDVNRFWFGTLGSDEVVLAVTAVDAIEVHCHGGRRVVRWVIEQFTARGCIETTRTHRPSGDGFELLQRAPTLRTATILLDQLNGAFATEVRRILAFLETDSVGARSLLYPLADFGNTVGRHLVEPWKVVIAGPPNVGKSSLVNALAGYQRSVVSEVAGTTRDAVSVRTAFDGWPFELIDTAGLREAEGLEVEGIARTKNEVQSADLILWVVDSTGEMIWPDTAYPRERLQIVFNKIDLFPDPGTFGLSEVSATTGFGIPELIVDVTRSLIPVYPQPGQAIPFTPQLADLVEAANAALGANRKEDAARLLREALAAAG